MLALGLWLRMQWSQWQSCNKYFQKNVSHCSLYICQYKRFNLPGPLLYSKHFQGCFVTWHSLFSGQMSLYFIYVYNKKVKPGAFLASHLYINFLFWFYDLTINPYYEISLILDLNSEFEFFSLILQVCYSLVGDVWIHFVCLLFTGSLIRGKRVTHIQVCRNHM